MTMRIGWKNHLRLISRAAATWMFLMPIAGSAERSKATIVAGAVSLFYLIVCGIADGIDKNSAD